MISRCISVLASQFPSPVHQNDKRDNFDSEHARDQKRLTEGQ